MLAAVVFPITHLLLYLDMKVPGKGSWLHYVLQAAGWVLVPLCWFVIGILIFFHPGVFRDILLSLVFMLRLGLYLATHFDRSWCPLLVWAAMAVTFVLVVELALAQLTVAALFGYALVIGNLLEVHVVVATYGHKTVI